MYIRPMTNFMRRMAILGLLFSAMFTWAGEADNVLHQSGERFKSAKYWTLNFNMSVGSASTGTKSGYKGELLLGPNDKFRLKVPGQQYTSDGLTLWQYVVAQKQVMVKNVADLQGALHPSEALFRYLKCKPISMTKQTQQGIAIYVMKLDPTGQVKGFTGMEVWLKVSDQTPIRLTTTDRTGTTATYDISDLTPNPPLKDADFKFVTPEGVEEIDMR